MPYQIPLGPQVKIGVRIGYAKAPTAKLIFMSLTGGTVTVTCSGGGVAGDVVLAPTDSDTANSPAGYIGTLEITGLAEFTQYTYTATKGADSVSGSFYTLPGWEDDFCFYAITCDAPVSAGVNGGWTDGEGFYKDIKAQVQAGGLPCVGILHLDDHGYTAARQFTDAAAVGLDAARPSKLNTHYAFSASYLSFYGMYSSGSAEMGTDVGGFGDSEAYTTTGNIDIGRVPARVWCMQNLPVWPQWGDWEFESDLGFDRPTTSPTQVANAYHKTYTAGIGNKDGGGYLAWQTFMAPLQPPSVASNDPDCNLWAFNLGCTRVIAVDGITKSQGAVTSYGTLPPSLLVDDAQAVSSIFGTGQIADIKAAIDVSAAFTFLGLANGIRYMSEYATEFYSGAQHPIKDHCPSEFNALFTDADSLSAIPATSGQYGQLFTVHGDLHHGHVYRHQITDGVVPTDFYEIGVGTVTTSYNHSALLYKNTSIPLLEYDIGESHRGSLIEYINKLVGYMADTEYHTYWGARISVYGSRAIPELVIELFGKDGVLWSGKFLGHKGAQKYSSTVEVAQIVGTSHP